MGVNDLMEMMGWGRASETPETPTRPNEPRWTKLPVVEREITFAEVSKRTWNPAGGKDKRSFLQTAVLRKPHCVSARARACEKGSGGV